MGDEVVADPDALLAHARDVRHRLLAIDVAAYRTALGRFRGAGANDVGDGHLVDLGDAVATVLEDLERGNWAAELFAHELRRLDAAGAVGRPTSVTMTPPAIAALRRRVAALPGPELLDGAHFRARVLVDDLRADLTTASDPAANPRARAAADHRLASHLAGLLDAGIRDDPDLQATVVGMLGPGWLGDFAAMAARRDRDGTPGVPWTRAALAVVAGWTATWVRRQAPPDRAAFVAALPPGLVPVLATLADWGTAATAAAAVASWDAPLAAPLHPVAPDGWTGAAAGAGAVPAGWPPASSTREAVAVMLAARPAAAHRVLTRRDDILATLVTSTDHPAAAEAVRAALVRHPTRRLSAAQDTSAVRASATALARLLASDAGPGRRTLTPGGRAAVAATTRFHHRVLGQGRTVSLRPFLHDGSGTHAALVDEVVADEAARNPDHLRRLVPELTGPELAGLVATLARVGGRAAPALVAVGHEFVALLGDHATSARRTVEAAGPQAVALLTEAGVEAGDPDLLAGLGRAVTTALSDMPWERQRDWLTMLAAADDGAGWASVLLANSDAPPVTMLPVLLSLEGPAAMHPRAPAVRAVLDDRTGDWTAWSTQLYTDMFSRHPAPLAAVLGMAAGRLPGNAPATDDGSALDVRRAGSRLASGAVSPGLARAICELVAARPAEVVALLDDVDRGDAAAFSGLAALVELTRADAGPGSLADAVGGHLLAEAFAASAVPLATGRADVDDLDLVRGRFHRAGELMGQVEAFARPRGVVVDTAVALRVVVVRLVDEVPVVGTIAAAADDALTLAAATDSPVPARDVVAREERASILAAMDLLSSASTTRRRLLEDFGFVLDGAGEVAAVPDPATVDPNAVLAAHPEYLPFFVAAEALADGLDAGRRVLD